MSEFSDRPDRFGCVKVATVLLMGLLVGVAIIWIVASGQFDRLLGSNQPGGPGGTAEPGVNAPIPEISSRLYTTGSAQATVSGSFQFSGQIAIDSPASYTTPNERTWISFIDRANPDAGEILVVFGEPENSVTVARGTTVAIGGDDDCNFNIQVTASSVSGSVSCASVEVMTDGSPTGTSSIQLQFSTTSVPWDGVDGGPDPYENAPTDEPEAT